MFGFRSLRARYRLAVANADFRRCRDEWSEAYRRQDARRMGHASIELRRARQAQLRAELDLSKIARPRGVQVAQ